MIKKHGVKYQFGSTPQVGCQDGTFTIKTLLQLRCNHNLPTWVAFADLVKAFDTSNHQFMVMILARYGCPPNLCDTITRMYKDSVVKLVIGKFETTIDFKVGVKQGYSVAPVLLLFIVMEFAKTLEKEWTLKGLTKAKISRDNNSPLSDVQLISHQPQYFNCGALFKLFCMIYVDDRAFVFESRHQLKLVFPCFCGTLQSLG